MHAVTNEDAGSVGAKDKRRIRCVHAYPLNEARTYDGSEGQRGWERATDPSPRVSRGRYESFFLTQGLDLDRPISIPTHVYYNAHTHARERTSRVGELKFYATFRRGTGGRKNQ